MTDPKDRPRRPAAFRLDDAEIVTGGADTASRGDGRGTRVILESDDDAAVPAAPLPRKKRFRWGRLFWGTLSALVAMAIGLSLDALIRDLFARNDWLGWAGLALVGLLTVSALAILGRELAGIFRLERIDQLRVDAAAAVATDDAKSARTVVEGLVALYRDRPETARGRADVAVHLGEIIDGRDLLVLAESDLLLPLDRTARRLVADAAKKVSVVTAVSPRAVIDLLFVAVAVMGLIRKLADLYGGRPGLIGFIGLMRHVIAHLAVTGGMAATDSLLHDVVGHGIAARLSSRLGEGVINGLLTARVGLAAIDVCRPMPFINAERPGVQDVMRGVFPEAERKT
ncbi:YcjF family protein [Methylobrevis pamukkalensis]|uniref:TIGR01620 family protein n=1 Tax=Methylobrevis pamukkalensis TaxID=1439726 RepID=A0A1E3H350_9HYPH|nr:TIGR01620 family protein [Methylobrevis pamukkalensis]ODN70757.1 hypothetical protein A6302_01917 [Methylobrevis pamukkalensis]